MVGRISLEASPETQSSEDERLPTLLRRSTPFWETRFRAPWPGNRSPPSGKYLLQHSSAAIIWHLCQWAIQTPTHHVKNRVRRCREIFFPAVVFFCHVHSLLSISILLFTDIRDQYLFGRNHFRRSSSSQSHRCPVMRRPCHDRSSHLKNNHTCCLDSITI